MVTLGQITERIGDGIHGTPSFDDNGVCYFFNGSNISDGHLIVTADTKKVSESEYELHKKELGNNTILISINGTIGNLALYNGEHCILGKSAAYLNVKENISRNYVYYCMMSHNFKNYISNANGSTIKNVSLRMLREYSFDLPDFEIQKKISFILKTIDDKIEINDRINDYLQQLIDVIYLDCIEKYSTGHDITIGSISKIYSGGTPQTSEESYWGGEFNWLSSGETRNKFINCTEKTITQQGIDNSSTKKAFKNDIVIASAGQGLTRGQTSLLTIDTYVNQSIIVIHPLDQYYPVIFANITKRYDELRTISDSSSIRGSITTGMISDLTMPELTEKGLDYFNKMSKIAIDLISKNINENMKLSLIRDILLPKLMSGEIDVSKLELNS